MDSSRARVQSKMCKSFFFLSVWEYFPASFKMPNFIPSLFLMKCFVPDLYNTMTKLQAAFWIVLNLFPHFKSNHVGCKNL